MKEYWWNRRRLAEKTPLEFTNRKYFLARCSERRALICRQITTLAMVPLFCKMGFLNRHKLGFRMICSMTSAWFSIFGNELVAGRFVHLDDSCFHSYFSARVGKVGDQYAVVSGGDLSIPAFGDAAKKVRAQSWPFWFSAHFSFEEAQRTDVVNFKSLIFASMLVIFAYYSRGNQMSESDSEEAIIHNLGLYFFIFTNINDNWNERNWNKLSTGKSTRWIHFTISIRGPLWFNSFDQPVCLQSVQTPV